MSACACTGRDGLVSVDSMRASEGSSEKERRRKLPGPTQKKKKKVFSVKRRREKKRRLEGKRESPCV